MIRFRSAGHFNESVNAFGTVESADSGGLAFLFFFSLSPSPLRPPTVLKFNYSQSVVF